MQVVLNFSRAGICSPAVTMLARNLDVAVALLEDHALGICSGYHTALLVSLRHAWRHSC